MAFGVIVNVQYKPKKKKNKNTSKRAKSHKTNQTTYNTRILHIGII